MTSVAATVITVRSERNSSDESANRVERGLENENIPFPNFDRIHCIVFKPE